MIDKLKKVKIIRQVEEEYTVDRVEQMIQKVERDRAEALLAIGKYDTRLAELSALLKQVTDNL